MRHGGESTGFCKGSPLRSALPVALLSVVLVSLISLTSCVTKQAAPAIESVAFSALPPQAIQAGSQATLAASVASDPQDMGVDWIASCASANCGSFNPTHTLSGVSTTYTAPSSPPQGCQAPVGQAPPPCVYLTAKSTALPSQTSTVSVNIFTKVTISLTQVPPSPLTGGTTAQVTAQVTGDPNGLGVDWTLTCGGTCGTITTQTASGSPATYTAPSGLTSSLNVTITATAVADSSQQVTTTVTISPSATVSIAFAAPNAGGPPASMSTGATANVVAFVSNDTQNLGVDWSISCSNGANGCGTLQSGNANPTHTASGSPIQYTAPTTVPAGGLAVMITATATANPKAFVSATINVTVPVPTISSISGAPSQLTVGSSTPLVATVTNDPPTGGGVDWTVTCGDPGGACGTFNQGSHTASGVPITYTAPSAVPAGNTVTITAKSHANPQSVSPPVQITIQPSTAESIAFAKGANAPPAQMTTSATASIAAIITNPTVLNAVVNWSVSCGLNQPGACGSFSSAQTQSGSPDVYNAPSSVPTGGLTVTITAAASDNPSTVSINANIAISTPVIAVQITQAANTTAGTTEQLIATVTNDPSNEGVTWKATCTNTPVSAGCGTFGTSTEISGSNPPEFQVPYTAPASVPAAGLSVLITATDVANGTTDGTATITVAPNPNLGFLNGQYVLSVRGEEEGAYYALVGAIVADGAGNITKAELDLNGSNITPNTATGITGTYAIGSDGRGRMTLNTTAAFGSNTVLSFVVVNAPAAGPASALIDEFDGATSSGRLELQSQAAVAAGLGAGSYAFLFVGEDQNYVNAVGVNTTDFGGVFTTDGQGNMTTITQDENDQGAPGETPPAKAVSPKMSLTGTYSALDQFGRGTATFNSSGSPFSYFVFYIVNVGELRFISDGTQDFNFAVDGPAYSNQGASFSGPYAFTMAGVDDTEVPPPTNGAAANVVSGGLFSASGTGLSSGSIDVNDGGALTSNSALSTSSFTAASGGRGTFALTAINNVPFSEFAFYPTTSNGVLLMELDNEAANVGTALPAAPGASFSGNAGTYAMDFTTFTSGHGAREEDADGQLISDGVSTILGTADVDQIGNGTSAGVPLTGSFSCSNSTPRCPVTLTVNSNQTLKDVFYAVNNAPGPLTNANTVTGHLSGQSDSTCGTATACLSFALPVGTKNVGVVLSKVAGGTFSATVVFETSVNSGNTWQSASCSGSSSQTAPSLTICAPPAGATFRVRTSSYTSGTVGATIIADDTAETNFAPGTGTSDPNGPPPVSCNPSNASSALGEVLYFDTSTAQLFYCSATNGWAQFTGTGSGTVLFIEMDSSPQLGVEQSSGILELQQLE